MKNEEIEAAKVVDILHAKQALDDKKENDSLSRYFKVLSFSELIDETTLLIEELNRVGSTEEMIKKSKMILKELGLRLKNSQGLSRSFLKMKEELENKLSRS
ncbi:MAG: hypothetical protein K9K67_13675 [Bacteriovoracaceae bacterium]|nr:hypothetical protein [Bacteriovoracaceae bacterium]